MNKIAFIDCEYTGVHIYTTLISLGLVTLDGRELHVIVNDFDTRQLTDWVRRNVLDKIDMSEAVSSREAYEIVAPFLEEYSQGQPVSLVTAGKSLDILLLFQLYHHAFPEREFFHFGECLPPYLNHRSHFDLDTLFMAAGVDPEVNREQFVDDPNFADKHNALYDAHVVRLCFLKLLEEGKLPYLPVDLPLRR